MGAVTAPMRAVTAPMHLVNFDENKLIFVTKTTTKIPQFSSTKRKLKLKTKTKIQLIDEDND